MATMADGTWSSLPDMPSVRNSHGMVVTPDGSKLICAGGNDGSSSLKTVVAFESFESSWQGSWASGTTAPLTITGVDLGDAELNSVTIKSNFHRVIDVTRTIELRIFGNPGESKSGRYKGELFMESEEGNLFQLTDPSLNVWDAGLGGDVWKKLRFVRTRTWKGAISLAPKVDVADRYPAVIHRKQAQRQFGQDHPLTVTTLGGDQFIVTDWGTCKDLREALSKMASKLGDPASFVLVAVDAGGGVARTLDPMYGSEDRCKLLAGYIPLELNLMYDSATD
jgi:hypothetical protein